MFFGPKISVTLLDNVGYECIHTLHGDSRYFDFVTALTLALDRFIDCIVD